MADDKLELFAYDRMYESLVTLGIGNPGVPLPPNVVRRPSSAVMEAAKCLCNLHFFPGGPFCPRCGIFHQLPPGTKLKARLVCGCGYESEEVPFPPTLEDRLVLLDIERHEAEEDG